MRNAFLLGLGLAVLGACVGPVERPRVDLNCLSQGFEPNTAAYAKCQNDRLERIRELERDVQERLLRDAVRGQP